MKKINIVFILEHFYPHIGGAETLFFNLTKELSKDKKFNLIVLTSNSGGITGKKQFFDNFEVYYFKWPSYFGHPIPIFNDVKDFVKKADIIHTGTYTSGFFSFFYAKFLKKRIMITVYENLFYRWFLIENFVKGLIFFLFEFITLHLPFDFYITISKATKSDLQKVWINDKKIEVIYPFLTDRFGNKKLLNKKIKKYFLYYGRPGKTKGIFLLLKAIKNLKNYLKRKKFYFVFVLANDPINERNKFILKVKEENLFDLIKIIPPQTDDELQKIILESYCVVVPSVTEGFGYTAYESLVLKKPVVVSDAGSLPEIVSGYHLIFKNRDVQDLSNKIKEAINGNFLYKKYFKVNKNVEINKLKKIYFDFKN